MLRIFLLSLGLVTALIVGPARAAVIPAPVSIQHGNGFTVLPLPLQLLGVDAALVSEQQLLQQYLNSADIAFGGAAGPGIGLAIDQALTASAYRLEVGGTGVSIVGGDQAGVLHGLQTLRQLLAQADISEQGVQLAQLVITDQPRFGYRGMHLDVSRHFFDVDFIKRYIDLLALHKMNVFHWHLTDDQGWRLESKAFPRLTDVGAWRSGTVVGHTHDAGAMSDGRRYGGYYSWDEVREVVAYAAQRHIMVVPEIDVPGHASAMIAAYPELGCGESQAKVQTHFGVFPEILCPSDATFTFLETLLTEVAELFPGPYIHIGGDEVRKDRWEDCDLCDALMKAHALEDHGELQAWFVNRTETIVNALGKRIIGWDEILDGEVRPSATVMSWRGQEGGIRAARAGHDVIMTPLQHVYFDFYQGSSVDEPMAIHGLTRLPDVYAFQPVPAELSAKERGHILGAQANLWTEYVPTETDAERMVLPRMSALAEVLWTPVEKRNFEAFAQRLPALEAQLRALGYEVADSHYKPHIKASENDDGSFTVTLESLAQDMRYRIDGGAEQRYSAPFTVAKSGAVNAWTIQPDGSPLGDARLTLVDHAARGATIHGAKHAAALVDGRLATDRIFRYPEWASFGPEGVDLVIDLLRPAAVSSVSIGWQAGVHRKLFRPTAVSVLLKNSQGEWQLAAELDREAIAALDGHRIELNFPTATVGELRIVAASDQLHWSEEQSKDVPSTFKIDELVIR